MEFEDIIYLALLIFSVAFGLVYQKIEDNVQKKLVGTALGLLIILIVSGIHIIHPLIFVFVNAVIILYVDKRKCHLASITFSFLYLFFFRMVEYIGIPPSSGHTNLVQMMLTLKLVGLAFEVNSSYNSMKKKESGEKTDEEKCEDETNLVKLDFMEIFHYSFNYIGVLTGPYIRYRTFKDYFETPFKKHADWKTTSLNKIMYIPIYGILFLVATHYWPLSYALTDEFYNERSFLYRFWYIWPNFFIFRMRLYIGLVLSECICTVAGLGAYPIFAQPQTGHGPTKNFSELKKIQANPSELAKIEYDFETIHNVDPMESEFCPTYRQTMKHWNKCIQYWLAVCIYKRWPNKKFRALVTMGVSAYWHGIYLGHYICLGCAPFVFPIEDVWVKLILKQQTGLALKIWECLWVVFKMFFFSYLAIAFHLMTVDRIVRYYNSIYHAGIIIGVVLYVVGLQLLKRRRAAEKRKEKLSGNAELKVD